MIEQDDLTILFPKEIAVYTAGLYIPSQPTSQELRNLGERPQCLVLI